MTQNSVNKSMARLHTIWPPGDVKEVALQAQLLQLAASFEDQQDLIEMAIETARSQKKRRLEKAMAAIVGPDPPPPPPAAGAAVTGTVTQENKVDAHKKVLGKKFLLEVGGHNKWAVSAAMSSFLSCTTLPNVYDQLMNGIVNRDQFSVRSHGLLTKATAPTPKDFSDLGEQIFAAHAARVVVIFAAYTREVVDHLPWENERVLMDAIDEQTKILMGLAHRDACGQPIDEKSPSLGDIFSSSTHSHPAAAKVTPAPTTATAMMNLSTNGGGGGGKAPACWAPTGKNSWAATRPTNLTKGDKCSSCGGWGHMSAGCPKGSSFVGYCSVCHGANHKKTECSSVVKV